MEFLNKIKENKVYRIKTKIMKLIHTKNATRIKGHALMRNGVHCRYVMGHSYTQERTSITLYITVKSCQ